MQQGECTFSPSFILKRGQFSMGSTNLRLMSYTVISHSSLSPKRPKGYLGVAGSRCNVLFNWGSSRLHCWKSKDQLGDSGLQPQLGIWISVVFVIVPVTAVLALKPESYTFWDKVLTFYVRSKIGRAPAFFVLNVHGTMSCPKCAGGCHPQLFASTL